MMIRLKSETCVRAGAECRCAPDAQCGDCVEYEVSREQAVALLAGAEASKGGHSSYLRRLAAQIVGNLDDATGLPPVEWSPRDGRYVFMAVE